MENSGMKKIITIVMIIAAVSGLWGCSMKDFTQTLTITEPEQVVEEFFKGIKTKDMDTLILYTKNEDINMLLHSAGNQEDLDLMYDSLFKNYSYKIVSVVKNEEESAAEAKVEVTNADFSKVLEKYQKKAYQYMENNLYSGNMSKKELNKKCMSIFAQQVKAASESEKTSTSTLTVHLDKNDNYSWNMKLTEEMMEKIMGGLIIPL